MGLYIMNMLIEVLWTNIAGLIIIIFELMIATIFNLFTLTVIYKHAIIINSGCLLKFRDLVFFLRE